MAVCEGEFKRAEEMLACAAKALDGEGRAELALAALGREETISELAREHGVSRKFIYEQLARAEEAVFESFTARSLEMEERVLFHLPVTGSWIKQCVLTLLLCCHAPYRGVIEFFASLLDYSISLGRIHNIMKAAVESARSVLAEEELGGIVAAALDEIFQKGKPVLCGVDVDSGYCFLLSEEKARDEATWKARLQERGRKGLHVERVISDDGSGLTAAVASGLPGVDHWDDLFHRIKDANDVIRFLDNRAYRAIEARDKLERKMATLKRKADGRGLSAKLGAARGAEEAAIELAENTAILMRWLWEDVLAVMGPLLDERKQLFDWIVDELATLEQQCPHRLRKLRVCLQNHRDGLLAFATWLEEQLSVLAFEHGHTLQEMHALFAMTRTGAGGAAHAMIQNLLIRKLGQHSYADIRADLDQLYSECIRASSLVENLNSRLALLLLPQKTRRQRLLRPLALLPQSQAHPTQQKETSGEEEPC